MKLKNYHLKGFAMLTRLFFIFVFSLPTLFGGTQYPKPMNKDFQKLVKTYANMKIEHPKLKAVTLAMMILESGRGQSKLAKVHKNYAGLKYRSEVKAYAKKIRYKANDGYDFYCRFRNHKEFIKGFWAFLDRKPYKGWRKSSHSPKQFIEKIAKKYCPFNPHYAKKVLSLMKEAEVALNQYKKPLKSQRYALN